jgi:hypothetical protein
MAKAGRVKWGGVAANLAIVFISLSSLFATVSWIGSSKASGPASDYKTAALGIMILRLESETEASTARVQAQTCLTQASMYYAYADKENDENVKRYLENLGDTSLAMSNFYLIKAENAENKAQAYYEDYSNKLAMAGNLGNVADYRSTAALIFTAAAILGSSGSLIKRREVIYLAIPIFVIAWYFLISSFFV